MNQTPGIAAVALQQDGGHRFAGGREAGISVDHDAADGLQFPFDQLEDRFDVRQVEDVPRQMEQQIFDGKDLQLRQQLGAGRPDTPHKLHGLFERRQRWGHGGRHGGRELLLHK